MSLTKINTVSLNNDLVLNILTTALRHMELDKTTDRNTKAMQCYKLLKVGMQCPDFVPSLKGHVLQHGALPTMTINEFQWTKAMPTVYRRFGMQGVAQVAEESWRRGNQTFAKYIVSRQPLKYASFYEVKTQLLDVFNAASLERNFPRMEWIVEHCPRIFQGETLEAPKGDVGTHTPMLVLLARIRSMTNNTIEWGMLYGVQIVTLMLQYDLVCLEAAKILASTPEEAQQALVTTAGIVPMQLSWDQLVQLLMSTIEGRMQFSMPDEVVRWWLQQDGFQVHYSTVETWVRKRVIGKLKVLIGVMIEDKVKGNENGGWSRVIGGHEAMFHPVQHVDADLTAKLRQCAV